jgi:hypothetical protein
MSEQDRFEGEEDEVEAHVKQKGASIDESESDDDNDVEAHVKQKG